jgi:hypothetical protein
MNAQLATPPTAAPTTTTLPPLRFSIVVPLDPAAAFRLFTDGIAGWWPVGTHSVGKERAVTTRIEPGVGGRCFETWDDGQERDWGVVRTWEPGRELVIGWYPGSTPDQAQEVAVRFAGEGSGTRVELEHRGWEVLGAQAEKVRQAYGSGWPVVFGQRYRDAAEAAAKE